MADRWTLLIIGLVVFVFFLSLTWFWKYEGPMQRVQGARRSVLKAQDEMKRSISDAYSGFVSQIEATKAGFRELASEHRDAILLTIKSEDARLAASQAAADKAVAEAEQALQDLRQAVRK